MMAAMPGRRDVLQEALQEQTAGDHRAGVAGADDAVHLSLGQQLPAAADGVVRLLAQGDDGRLVHADDLGAVEDSDAVAVGDAVRQERLDLGLIADEHDAQFRVERRRPARAPATIGPGAWSPPIASSAIRMVYFSSSVATTSRFW